MSPLSSPALVSNLSRRVPASRFLFRDSPFELLEAYFPIPSSFRRTTYAAYRWRAFHDAIKTTYPHLKIIATTRPVTTLDPPEEYSSSSFTILHRLLFTAPANTHLFSYLQPIDTSTTLRSGSRQTPDDTITTLDLDLSCKLEPSSRYLF